MKKPVRKNVMISLWEPEHEKIKAQADKLGLSVSQLLRDACEYMDAPYPACVQPKVQEIAQELSIPASRVADRIVLTWIARKLAWELVNGPLDMGKLEEFIMPERIPDDAFFQFIMREFSVELRAAKLAEVEALSKSMEATEAALAKVEAKAAKGRKSA